jgi:hypothetical protein
MKVELIRDTPKESGALTSRVYIDGSFFGYGLENNFYKFPNGSYNLIGKYSPTFKKNKIYIDVPNRENIMFHGGNSIDDTKGCVIIAAQQNGDNVSGDLSQKFFDVIDAAGRNGEAVGLIVRNSYKRMFLILGALGIVGIYLSLKR